jgi:hypothetical protein
MKKLFALLLALLMVLSLVGCGKIRTPDNYYIDQYENGWSILYKDEAALLDAAEDVDKVYVEQVLPGKMKYNLRAIYQFSFFGDIKTMFRTVFAVLGKDYGEEEGLNG